MVAVLGTVVAVVVVTGVTWFCRNCGKRGPHDHWEDKHNEAYKCHHCGVVQLYKK